MTETSHLGLPLLAPAQAQKHVTVNEALTRLDAMVQLRVISTSLATPPSSAIEGDCYGVPVGAVNDWAGRDGEEIDLSLMQLKQTLAKGHAGLSSKIC